MDAFNNIRAAVFDIGGTLLDFDQPESLAQLSDGINAAYEHLDQAGRKLPSLRRYSAVMRRKALLSLIAAKLRRREPDTMKLLREGHARLGISLDDHAMTALGRVAYSPTKSLAHAKPETATALATLRDRGYHLAIVSNTLAPPPGLDEHLADEALLEYFPIRVYSCAFGVAKPNPAIFRAVLAELDVAAEQAVYIGDKPEIDVKGAHRVGMHTILRAPRGSSDHVHPQPDAVIREIPEVLDLLPSLTP